MEVTEIIIDRLNSEEPISKKSSEFNLIIDGDGFDSKDDHEFMHSVGQYYAYR